MTKYVVMLSEKGHTWTGTDIIEARNDEVAIKQVAKRVIDDKPGAEGYQWVAVPLRNWNPKTADLEVRTEVTLAPANAAAADDADAAGPGGD